MFTGIIEEIGVVRSIQSIGSGRKINVAAVKVFDELKVDDSIALDGVCQTVVSISGRVFTVEAVDETMRKTNFSDFSSGKRINLERALTLSTRLGGHLVQGHTDCTGSVAAIRKETAGTLLEIKYPLEFSKYLVQTGSITINGVSLTVARLSSDSFTVSIIPHTWKMTTLSDLNIGAKVNLEFDIIGKYIEKLLGTESKTTKSLLDSFIEQPS